MGTREEMVDPLQLCSGLLAADRDAAVIVDSTSLVVLLVNPAFSSLSGLAAADALGRRLDALGLGALAEMVATEPQRSIVTWPDGMRMELQVSTSKLAIGTAGLTVFRLSAMAQRECLQAEYAAILETSVIGIAFLRSHPSPRHFLHCSPSFETMFGWAKGELIGRASAVIWQSPEHYREALASFEPLLRSGVALDTETILRRRDGSTFPCRLRARVIEVGEGRPNGTILFCEDVTDRRASQAALAAAVQAANDTSSAKTAFVAKLSHEIRTPLSGLIALSRLACDERAPPEKRDDYVRRMHTSALLLRDLLTDTLDLVKIEAGHIDVRNEPFALRALLKDLVSFWAATAADQEVELSCDVDVAVPDRVTGDAVKLRQILSNFISNALKFSRRGAIRLGCRLGAPGRVLIEVHDTGPGIDEAAQARLFQPFVQLGNKSGTIGTGLGLAICRELAARMGGSVGVCSKPGQGACFWVELPLLADAMGHEANANGDRDRVAACLAGKRVLVADDDEVGRLILASVLAEWNPRIDSVADGLAAADAARAAHAGGDPYDLLLTDLHMPIMDGIALAAGIRQHPGLSKLPIIGLSATVLDAERQSALRAGMNQVLSKPFETRTLFRSIVQVLTEAS